MREWRGQETDWVFLQKALPYGCLAYGIDQSAKRSQQAQTRRLDRGCKPGPGDFYIFYQGITVWAEKKEAAPQSESQKEFEREVKANGGTYLLYRAPEELEAGLRAAGIPLRASLGEIRGRIAEQNERLPAKKKRASGRSRGAANSMSVAQYRKLHERELL